MTAQSHTAEISVFLFEDDAEAISWLSGRGFSVGRLQGPSPRGILFGNYDIQKWRNLRPRDVQNLHGTLMRGTVRVWDNCPRKVLPPSPRLPGSRSNE